jgi:hypothetical protein
VEIALARQGLESSQIVARNLGAMACSAFWRVSAEPLQLVLLMLSARNPGPDCQLRQSDAAIEAD